MYASFEVLSVNIWQLTTAKYKNTQQNYFYYHNIWSFSGAVSFNSFYEWYYYCE